MANKQSIYNLESAFTAYRTAGLGGKGRAKKKFNKILIEFFNERGVEIALAEIKRYDRGRHRRTSLYDDTLQYILDSADSGVALDALRDEVGNFIQPPVGRSKQRFLIPDVLDEQKPFDLQILRRCMEHVGEFAVIHDNAGIDLNYSLWADIKYDQFSNEQRDIIPEAYRRERSPVKALSKLLKDEVLDDDTYPNADKIGFRFYSRKAKDLSGKYSADLKKQYSRLFEYVSNVRSDVDYEKFISIPGGWTVRPGFRGAASDDEKTMGEDLADQLDFIIPFSLLNMYYLSSTTTLYTSERSLNLLGPFQSYGQVCGSVVTARAPIEQNYKEMPDGVRDAILSQEQEKQQLPRTRSTSVENLFGYYHEAVGVTSRNLYKTFFEESCAQLGRKPEDYRKAWKDLFEIYDAPVLYGKEVDRLNNTEKAATESFTELGMTRHRGNSAKQILAWLFYSYTRSHINKRLRVNTIQVNKDLENFSEHLELLDNLKQINMPQELDTALENTQSDDADDRVEGRSYLKDLDKRLRGNLTGYPSGKKVKKTSILGKLNINLKKAQSINTTLSLAFKRHSIVKEVRQSLYSGTEGTMSVRSSGPEAKLFMENLAICMEGLYIMVFSAWINNMIERKLSASLLLKISAHLQERY
ncbi:TPA: hypothetical protein H1011_03655 [archaeon]|uniref:Uncharacterized protein n=1 Tax=Candidatus Undinarchaeum marinum TaxID=2756141 RepID=A0A832UQG8_9ARCH|nr:hypothetical protein [Candidatus Undinarchaeum marinum]